MAAPKKVMAVVLAGGEGKRLMPLTADRAKPAVPYGGVYRLVDFALSNLVNARYLRIVVVVGADHVYRMDFGQMVAAHIDSGAPCSVAAIRQPISLADQFGVIQARDDGVRIDQFLEKPTDPQGLPDAPDQVLASMGNY